MEWAKCKPFCCYFCTRRFSDFDIYQRHKRRHSPLNLTNILWWWFKVRHRSGGRFEIYMCKTCGKEYQSQSGLWKHTQTHLYYPFVGRGRMICKHCHKVVERFRFQEHVQIHKRKPKTQTSQKQNYFECSICKKAFNQAYKVKKHEQIHSDVKPLKCKYCNKRAMYKGNIVKHESTCIYSPSFKKVNCQFCQKQFTTTLHLQMHQVIRKEDGNLTHGMCKTFQEQQGRKHVKANDSHVHVESLSSTRATRTTDVDVSAKTTFSCPFCKQSFTSSKRLNSHRMVHLKNHECNTCRKTFSYPRDLVKHQRTHTKEKPHLCIHCGASFTQSSNLYRHERNVHFQQHGTCAPCRYPCKECGKDFSQSGHLKRHMRIHTGERPYVCSVCTADFNTIGHFRRHRVMVHNESKVRGSTPNALLCCQFCRAVFKSKQSVETHERTHTGTRPYECSICHQDFAQLGSLKQHFVRKHTGLTQSINEFH